MSAYNTQKVFMTFLLWFLSDYKLYCGLFDSRLKKEGDKQS